MANVIGSSAPAIEVDAYLRGTSEPVRVSLEDFTGRWVVVFFYPRDFTFVCPTELQALADIQESFTQEGAVVLAASTDSFYSHKAWFESDPRLIDVDYPVIADTSHEFGKGFGVLLEDGSALRATFIVGPEGTIRHAALTDLSVGRNVSEILRTLVALKTGELCPAGWRPGEPTLSAQLEAVAS